MSVESTLREAIRDRSPVSLHYATTGSAPRTVHPHVLFRAAGGEIFLDAYQVAGPTSSGERVPVWRQMNLVGITAIELLGGEFAAAPDFNRAADKYSAGLIASV
ncbi:MAG TPA: WYL domain-containing protein [Solirubrobacterales bacterium]|nr:WYL domain-containing protein [Solirubrobacterales bacterium]